MNSICLALHIHYYFFSIYKWMIIKTVIFYEWRWPTTLFWCIFFIFLNELMNGILRLVKHLLRFYSWMSMKHYTTIDLGMHTIYIIQCDKRKVSTAVNLKAVTSKMYKTVVYCDNTTSHIFTDKKIHRLPDNALDIAHLFVYC